MNDLSTIKLLLWIFAMTALRIGIAGGQTLTPIAPPASVVSDPASDADFYLNKAAVKIAEIRTFVDSIKNETELRQMPFRPVLFSKRDVQQAFQTLKLAKAQIDLLPITRAETGFSSTGGCRGERIGCRII